ncbi:MAG: class I SAM-dependent methyltransferase [Lachnospiraceae bacterium]
MVENIGKVKINLDLYSGVDLYSDGDVESEILDIVKAYPESEYDRIILERNSWPLLYHLSKQRENILSWYPFEKEASVLEVGAGCGAVTGAMLDRAGKVTALDLSKRRSLINANRHKDYDNLEVVVGNFNEAELSLKDKYDYITLIGVFEYGELYMGCENPYVTFLEKVNRLLKDGGKILIAIENRMGLKYFAGCKEDHVGKYFEGIEGYTQTSGVKTFSKHELEILLSEAGYEKYSFYYPYPDYKFPTAVYSDEFLPKAGELYNNIRNFDSDRWVLFDETKAFDTIISSGMFPVFSNSFFIEVEKKGD